MQEELPLNGARLTLEQRKGYLHLSLTGVVLTVTDVRALGTTLERVMEKTGVRRLLFDARGLEEDVPPPACEEVWAWLGARLYAQMAVILPATSAELGLTRFNMTGVSSQLPLRGFLNVMDGHRWLDMRMSGERRLSQIGIPAVKAATIPPPSAASSPPSGSPGPNEGEPVEKKRSGSYQTGGFEALLPGANGTDGSGGSGARER